MEAQAPPPLAPVPLEASKRAYWPSSASGGALPNPLYDPTLASAFLGTYAMPAAYPQPLSPFAPPRQPVVAEVQQPYRDEDLVLVMPKRRRKRWAKRAGRLDERRACQWLILLTLGWIIQVVCFRALQQQTSGAYLRLLSELSGTCTIRPDLGSVLYDDSYTHVRLYCPPSGVKLSLGSSWGMALEQQNLGQQYLVTGGWDVEVLVWALSVLPILFYFWLCPPKAPPCCDCTD
jgi:hypothetical protein